MTERTIKIKELIHDEVCMGTYGLVELELLEIEKEMEALQQLAVSKRSELLFDFYKWQRENGCLYSDSTQEYKMESDIDEFIKSKL